MGGSAGRRPVPRKKAPGRKKAPKKKAPVQKGRGRGRPPKPKPEPKSPQEVVSQLKGVPVFTAARRPQRRDGAIDWSTVETLEGADFGFYFNQYAYMGQRIKELETAREEVKTNLVALMELEDLESVGVDQNIVSLAEGTHVSLTKENLLAVGVSMKQIEKAAKKGKKKYTYLTRRAAGESGDEE